MRKLILLSASAFFGFTAQACAITGASPADDDRAKLEFQIGVDLVQHGRDADAVEHLDTALNQFPEDPGILSYLGHAHRSIAATRTGTSRAAELRLSAAYYRRVLEQDPEPKDFLEYMGQLYLSLDDTEAARSELRALGELCPEGCAQHDALAASLAAYLPPPPSILLSAETSSAAP